MGFLNEQLRLARLLPVLTVESEELAVALCRALQAGGFKAVEITLRTPAALAAIKAVKQTLPDLIVAAGTVLSAQDMENVADAGVDFAVSPGLTRSLSESARHAGLNFLPGVSTASEIIGGMELGHRVFKFFPAEACGGARLLNAFQAPFPGISFCPTGGLNNDNSLSYLKLRNVICLGGSWMIDENMIRRSQWPEISLAAQQCLTQLDAYTS